MPISVCRLLVAFAFVGLGVFNPFSPAAHAVTIGTVPDLTWGTSRADMDRTVSIMRRAGIKWVNVSVPWNAIESKGKGTLHESYMADIDYAVQKVRSAGILVLMTPVGTPYWASADPDKYIDAKGVKHWDKYWRPAHFAEYARFAGFLADRYKDQVNHYMVWNEPNHDRFWPSGVNAVEYKNMLRQAYAKIKQADPTSRVVMGGLSGNDWKYLIQLYKSGARPYFDIGAAHPYTGNVDPTLCWYESGTARYAKHAFCGLREVRRVMNNHNDKLKPIWLTEFGWSTCSCTYGVSESKQADYFTKALNLLGTKPYASVKKAFVYNFRNNYWASDANELEARFGLLRTDFTRKPAFYVIRNYALGL